MATSVERGRPTRAPGRAQGRAIRRRRSWAALAVVLCVAADGWWLWSGVSPADAGEPMADRPAHVPVPTSTHAPADDAEQVPEAARAGGRPTPTPASSTRATGQADHEGDGRDAQGAVIESGSGRFTVVSIPSSALRPPPSTGRIVRYTVEVEAGTDVAGPAFATTVGSVLSDPRGWQTKDRVRFVNVSPAEVAKGSPVDLRVTLASPDTTDRLCAPLETRGQVSCHNGGRVVLNLRRWVLGAEAYGTDVAGYRTYLVNHEVGHGIGHPHEYCGGKGKVAPVMMQQTYGLKGCTAWPWPTAEPA